MSRQLLSVLLLGSWLGMLVASWVVATVNFRMVDRVLGPALRPEVSARLAPVPADDRRVVLRHLASELNRWMFRWWSFAQLLLGAAVVAALWARGGAARYLALAALALVVVQLTALAPAIARIGRTLDFVPRPLPPDTGRPFGILHAAYVLSDFAKALLVAAAAWAAGRR